MPALGEPMRMVPKKGICSCSPQTSMKLGRPACAKSIVIEQLVNSVSFPNA